jgi:hypothetical protein
MTDDFSFGLDPTAWRIDSDPETDDDATVFSAVYKGPDGQGLDDFYFVLDADVTDGTYEARLSNSGEVDPFIVVRDEDGDAFRADVNDLTTRLLEPVPEKENNPVVHLYAEWFHNGKGEPYEFPAEFL